MKKKSTLLFNSNGMIAIAFVIVVTAISSCIMLQILVLPALPPQTVLPKIKSTIQKRLKGLVSFEGLEVNTMATEPMLKNPTNIDVDDRGRVWVTEAYNYRPAINGNPVNEKATVS